MKWKKSWIVPSTSNPNTKYVVSLSTEGQYGCSCPVWKFRREQCKHIQSVKCGCPGTEQANNSVNGDYTPSDVPGLTGGGVTIRGAIR